MAKTETPMELQLEKLRLKEESANKVRIASKQISAEQGTKFKIANARLKLAGKSYKSQIKAIQTLRPKESYSKGQQMLNELFSGREEPTWGTGNNLPVIDGALRSGGGLMKNGDNERRTGRMFGLR